MSLILLGILNSQVSGAAAGEAYDLLESTVLTSSASSVTFTGLGSYTDYKHLQIRMTAKSTNLRTSTSIRMRLNSDTGSAYSHHFLDGNGSSVSSGASTSSTYLNLVSMPAALAIETNSYAAAVTDILDFSSSSKNTTIRTLGGYLADGTQIRLSSGLYISTSAITSLQVYADDPDFATGSRFSLYGVK